MLTACATGVLSLSSYVMLHKCSNSMKDLYSNNWQKRHCMTYVYSGRNLGGRHFTHQLLPRVSGPGHGNCVAHLLSH